MRLNRKWILVIALVLSMTTAISGTLAYLTAQTATVTNTFTIGNVSISLNEPNWKPDEAILYPGASVAKDPTITNTGRTPAWVWMEVEIPADVYPYIALETVDESAWTVKKDDTSGVITLLYKTELAAQGTATPFTSVKLAENANLGDLTTFDMKVTGYAIQDSFDNVEAAYLAYKAESGEPGVTYEEVATADELSTALQNGQNVKLTGDITDASAITVPAGKSVIIDLNNNEITGTYQAGSSDKHVYAIENNGTLTLKNGTVNSRGVMNNGNLTIENGTYNAIDTNGGAAVWNSSGSTLTIKGGTFTSADASSSPAASVLHIAAGSTATIDGGTFTANADWTYAVISSGTLTINDGTFNSEHGAIAAEAGTVTIKDGTFGITGSGHVVYNAGATVTIDGGSFKHEQANATAEGNVVIYAATGSVVVNGGSFDSVSAAFGYNSHKNNMQITESNCTFTNAANNWYDQ